MDFLKNCVNIVFAQRMTDEKKVVVEMEVILNCPHWHKKYYEISKQYFDFLFRQMNIFAKGKKSRFRAQENVVFSRKYIKECILFLSQGGKMRNGTDGQRTQETGKKVW